MSSYFDETKFRRQVDSCLDKVRLVLDTNKANTLASADVVPHKYDDKYVLTSYLINTAAYCDLNCWKLLGVTQSQLEILKEWSGHKDISFRFQSTETCDFVKETSKDVESVDKYVTESTFGFKTTSKVVTTITEYLYFYKVDYSITAFRGVGEKPEDKVVIQSRGATKDITLRAKSAPYPEATTKTFDVNVSWLLHNLNNTAEQMQFTIDRTKKDCFTPRRNTDVYLAERFFAEFATWSMNVNHYLLVVSLFHVQSRHTEHYKIDSKAINAEGVFVPVVPLLANNEEDLTADGATSAVLLDKVDVSSVVSASTASICTALTTSSQVSLSATVVDRLLVEQERSLRERLSQMDVLFIESHHTVFTAKEARLAVICSHIADISSHLHDGVGFIEDMLRKQLISAVGKELQPSDFAAYMQFHNRKLLKPEFQAVPFTHSIRRSVAHSPEGTLRIETLVFGNGCTPTVEPIYTVAQHSASSVQNQMEFTLNAATKVRFGGDRHVHGWLAHSFSHQSSPQLSLVAQARQFSSFIVLVGRIASATLFEPKHAFIVQNKDDVNIPLLLEQIPTPKEFRDAIESLSPEQQRFAKAFRGMQLESTLFGVCVIQIKPQLEKVLNLSPDSLTKEIQLTQDLMRLFTEYQIPTDLMSFDGSESASASERLEAVRGHVKAILDMLEAAKQQEIKQKNEERQFAYGRQSLAPPPPPMAMASYAAPLRSYNDLMSMPLGSKGGRGMSTPPGGMDMFGGAPPGVLSFSTAEMKMKKMSISSSIGSGGIAPASSHRSREVSDSSVGSASVYLSSVEAAPSVHVVINAPTPNTNQVAEKDNYSGVSGSGAVSLDYTQLPTQLDRNYDKFDTDSALRPTIINVGDLWTKKSQAALLAGQSTKTMNVSEQTTEKTAAFDLLDALSRSGALCIEDASLHVVIAATHSFDQSLMDTVVKGNVNPIERVERSTLIMASTLHGLPAADLVAANHLDRVTTYSPSLFITNA